MRSRHGVLGVVLLLAVLALSWPSTASAVRLARVATNFDQLTHVAAPRRGDRAGVLYVVEREGQIWRVLGGRRTLFLSIRGLVSCCGGERGLMSMAFDPAYRTNRLFYVFHTDNGGDLRVARYRANAASTRAIWRSRRVILSVEHSRFSNHNGGQLAFSNGGRLYATTGDGGGACDPNGSAQRLRSRLGKLLSISPRRLGAGWRIDGYGLRNTFRFSFDRATGRLYLADVGQDAWEEINTRAARFLGGSRENYGWDVFEGRAASGCSHGRLNPAGTHARPISVYGHALGCSITGGFAYRGTQLPSRLRGWYFFGDFCSGTIWRIAVSTRGRLVGGRRVVVGTSHNITSFGEGVRGELYVATQAGSVYKLVRS
jgi:glucose/arabinose dehydrogenase